MKKNYILFFLLLFSLFVPAQNVGVLEIISPDINNSCGNISEELVVTIRPDYSSGYTEMVPCYYQLNNGPIVHEDLSFLIGIFNLNLSFSQPIIPIEGMNTLRVWTDLPGDPDASNNEVTIQFDLSINNPATPWTENAESFPQVQDPEGNLDCWVLYAISSYDTPDTYSTWGVVDASSHQYAPLPVSGTKVFSPTFKSNFFSNLYLESPDIDISTLNLAELSFDYHVYGRSQGPLSVEIYYSDEWTTIGAVTQDDRQLQIIDPWRKKTILLDGYDGIIKIRFNYSDPDWFGWYTGDYGHVGFTGIDTIEVKEAPTCPSPKNITINYNEIYNEITKETAKITWDPGHVETNWEIEYGPRGFSLGTGTTIQTSQSSYTLTGLTSGNEYDVYVRAICGTAPGVNDSGVVSTNFQTVCSFVAPWTEDVELHSGTTRGIIENCWKTDRYETHSYRWDIVANGAGTNSANTGPSQAYEGNTYFHIESTYINGGADFIIAAGAITSIYSPYIDISSLSVPALNFYYHMYGANIGALKVDVFTNGSWVEDVHVISGEQQTASSDPWVNALVDLSAFSGEIRLRFTGMSSPTAAHSSDIAIDLIQIDELQVLSTSEVNTTSGIILYPNPVDDFVNIQSKEHVDSIKLFDIEGKMLLNFYPTANEDIKIPVSKFTAGMYFIEITSKQKKEVFKMLKR